MDKKPTCSELLKKIEQLEINEPDTMPPANDLKEYFNVIKLIEAFWLKTVKLNLIIPFKKTK